MLGFFLKISRVHTSEIVCSPNNNKPFYLFSYLHKNGFLYDLGCFYFAKQFIHACPNIGTSPGRVKRGSLMRKGYPLLRQQKNEPDCLIRRYTPSPRHQANKHSFLSGSSDTPISRIPSTQQIGRLLCCRHGRER